MNPFTESTVARPLAENADAQTSIPPELAATPPAPDSPQLEPRAVVHTPAPLSLAQRAPSPALARVFAAAWLCASNAGVGAVAKRAMVAARQRAGIVRVVCKRLRPGAFLLAAGLNLAVSGLAVAVDVNVATAEQLRSVRGIGPKTAQIIVEERMRGGRYESFDDLSERVKGIGPKKSATLQASGLTLGKGGGAASSPARAAPSSAPGGRAANAK